MNRSQQMMNALVFVVAMLCSALASAQLSVAPIFSDGMVLQRDAPVPVFGTAEPGVEITVLFGGASHTTTADSGGRWRVTFGPLQTTDPSSLTVFGGGETRSFAGVRAGEVWFCSGQSNMGWSLSSSNDGAQAIADAGNHDIALFRMTAGNGPDTTAWQISDATTAGDFSAVCYWMGLELSQWLGGVPIGLIQATHDGTAIDRWQHSSDGIGDDYDAMVRSIQPYAVRGVLWYQGESNGGDAAYAGKLANLVREWRSDWGQDALPFGIVQLAYRSGWNVARNAQLEVADTIGDAFLVVIRDLPGGALHPPEKKPVGLRAAIGARGLVYGDGITWSGPIRDVANSYAVADTVVLHWKHAGDRLFTDDGLPPGEFKLAGANGRFKSATAEIVGDTVQVRSASVSDPVRVQYSYRSVGNLYNAVDIAVADGAASVDRLKASEFEFTVARGGNQPPTAAFDYSVSGLVVSLDASASSDPDGFLAAVEWDFGDGSAASGPLVTDHEYLDPDSYTITLTVTDNGGASDALSRSVMVTDGGGSASTMHVSSLTAFAEGAGRGFKRGVASVVVRDELNNPVAGATVTAQFSGTFNEPASGITDAGGTVDLRTVGEAKGAVAVSACIDHVDHEALTYSPNGTDCG